MNAGVPVCHVTTAAVAPCRVVMLAALLAMLVLLVPMAAVLLAMLVLLVPMAAVLLAIRPAWVVMVLSLLVMLTALAAMLLEFESCTFAKRTILLASVAMAAVLVATCALSPGSSPPTPPSMCLGIWEISIV